MAGRVAYSIFPTMLIQEKPLTRWVDNFYGYGSWQSPIWFVGYEEGGGDTPEEVAEKFNYFYTVHNSSTEATLCDIRELYQHVAARINGSKADLFTTLYDYRFGNNSQLHGYWKNIIAFVHGYRHKKLPDLLTYQRETFASSSAPSEALISLYPLPSTHNHAWYYSWLDLPIDYLKSRDVYEQHFYAPRIHSILRRMREHKPEIVVMYGMDNINVLKKSVQEFFPAATFSMVKAIKQQIPQHHRADFNGTTLLITTQIPALRHNRIESGFDWQKFGESIKV